LATPSGNSPYIHHSEPNYLWAEAGTNFGVFNDNDPSQVPGGTNENADQHLTGLLQKAGKTWRSYQQDTDLTTNAGGQLTNLPLPRDQWTVPLVNHSGIFGTGSLLNARGELLMLGFDLSERAISRWVKRAPKDPDRAKRWLTFFRNHREAIAAMDFFTVPTITFGLLYCFFVISHDRRRILHVNVTKPDERLGHPAVAGGVPFETSLKCLVFDRDRKFAFRGDRSGESHQDNSQANFIPQSLAEWHRGALGGKLQKRPPGPHGCAE
jgi:hypothetical protein